MTAKEISEKIQAFTINNPGKFMPETFRQLIEDHIIHFSKQQIKEYREWEKNKTNLKKIYRKMMK